LSPAAETDFYDVSSSFARHCMARQPYNAEAARSDSRNVMGRAEYDDGDQQVRDFDKPVPDAT
jgi:hypothetical protein